LFVWSPAWSVSDSLSCSILGILILVPDNFVPKAFPLYILNLVLKLVSPVLVLEWLDSYVSWPCSEGRLSIHHLGSHPCFPGGWSYDPLVVAPPLRGRLLPVMPSQHSKSTFPDHLVSLFDLTTLVIFCDVSPINFLWFSGFCSWVSGYRQFWYWLGSGGYSSSIAPIASLINIPESKMPGAINLSGPGYPLHVYIYLGWSISWSLRMRYWYYNSSHYYNVNVWYSSITLCIQVLQLELLSM